MSDTLVGGLDPGDIVSVSINLTPRATPARNFGVALFAGPSDVIDVRERIRRYASLDDIAGDFGTTAPEYHAANLFFAQNPRPSICYIGRFAHTATSGRLNGKVFSSTQAATLLSTLRTTANGTMAVTVDGILQELGEDHAMLLGGNINTPDQAALITTLHGITNGEFGITIDGTLRQVGPMTFATIVTLTDAATRINTAMGTWGHCTWSGSRFELQSATTGTSSTITYAVPPTAGTDVSATLHLTAASGAWPPIQGTAHLSFTAITNLNGAASIIQSALRGASCQWTGQRFQIKSLSTGAVSTVSYATPIGIGTDLGAMLGLSEPGGASPPVDGIAPETPLDAATKLRKFKSWYGLNFAAPIDDQDHIDVATYIEAASPTSIYALTTQDDDELDPTVSDKLSRRMKALDLERTVMVYSSSSQYAAASVLGRAFTVNFEANNTMITLKFKQMPGVAYETLTEDQSAELAANNVNVFAYFTNEAMIIQEGVMANGFFFDEVHGTDWLQNRIQNDVFNVLYTAPTKVPQTDAGMQMLINAVTGSCTQGVQNGLIAPGIWNAPGFGQLVPGAALPSGFYIYAPLMASQSQADREKRVAPTIQCAIKQAGAIHFAGVVVNVNR